ncbi:alpha/beta hydrolase [Chthonobacter albigriseus]|uniref:alpha/beta hydrolase n=1 Tax=Chthonobacter albigriseus TaxID=1683161 RepID=UPI0015EEF7F6|nr:dienelactone hydrolase family protein [Chthonobacter albigriseus]
MAITLTRGSAPHAGQPVLSAGASPETARAAVILVHGRGAGADDILSLSAHLAESGDVAFLAPQARQAVWYPERFLVPRARNEPDLSAALAVIDGLVADLEAAGVAAENVVVAGFSQGACLSLEWAARSGRRLGGVVGFSGGLIGTDEEIETRSGSLSGTPVFLGCSDVDFHIPVERVHATARILAGLDAVVTERIYPGLGHTIVMDEVEAARRIVEAARKGVNT